MTQPNENEDSHRLRAVRTQLSIAKADLREIRGLMPQYLNGEDLYKLETPDAIRKYVEHLQHIERRYNESLKV